MVEHAHRKHLVEFFVRNGEGTSVAGNKALGKIRKVEMSPGEDQTPKALVDGEVEFTPRATGETSRVGIDAIVDQLAAAVIAER